MGGGKLNCRLPVGQRGPSLSPAKLAEDSIKATLPVGGGMAHPVDRSETALLEGRKEPRAPVAVQGLGARNAVTQSPGR